MVGTYLHNKGGAHPPSFINEQPPFRAAVAGGSGAEKRSLCCRGTVFLHCMRWDIGSTPSINRMSVLEAPLSLIWIEYDWESASTIGEAEKWSNCRICGNIMHE